MKKNYWLIFFIINLCTHLLGIFFFIEILQLITKPLIIILLGGYFLSAVKFVADPLIKWVFSALFFSWIGDIMLMVQPGNEIFFMAGLIVFLLAHIFYIVFFHIIRIRESIRSNWLLLLLVVIYYGTFSSFLSSHLGDMKLPVRIYGAIISFMFMLALHMLFLKNKTAGGMMMSGAFLFIISDSVLAIHKFYMAYEWAGIIIMMTYGLAQLFIVHGAIKYIRSGKE